MDGRAGIRPNTPQGIHRGFLRVVGGTTEHSYERRHRGFCLRTHPYHDPGRAGLLQGIWTTEHLDQRWQCLRRGPCQGVGRGIADAGGGVTQSRKHYPRVEPGVIIGEEGAESLDGVLADIGALVVQGLRQ